MVAVITGATSGIGKAFAYECAHKGMALALVARNEQRLEDIAADIRSRYFVAVDILPADLSTSVGIEKVAAYIRSCPQLSRPLTMLVNNAGFGLGQDFTTGALEREKEGYTVMVRAVMLLSFAAAHVMSKQGRGIIVNISSMTALTAQGTYSAHKAWVRSFSLGLAQEVKERGVRVCAICPGLVRTEFHERSHVDSNQWKPWVFTTPDVVVQTAFQAIESGKTIATPTLLYRAASLFLKYAPRALVRKFAGPSLSGRQ